MRCDVALLKNVALHAKLPLEQLQLPANPLGVNSEGRKVRRQQGRQNSLTAMAQSFSESTERRLREFFKTDKAVTADRVGGFLFSIFFFSLSLSLSLSVPLFLFSFLFAIHFCPFHSVRQAVRSERALLALPASLSLGCSCYIRHTPIFRGCCARACCSIDRCLTFPSFASCFRGPPCLQLQVPVPQQLHFPRRRPVQAFVFWPTFLDSKSC